MRTSLVKSRLGLVDTPHLSSILQCRRHWGISRKGIDCLVLLESGVYRIPNHTHSAFFTTRSGSSFLSSPWKPKTILPTDNGSALSRLIFLIRPDRHQTTELDNVVRRLEFLQQLLAVPVQPDPAYVDQNIREIWQEINAVRNSVSWRPSPAQESAFDDFWWEMDKLPGSIAQPNSTGQNNRGGFSRYAKEHPILTAACGGALVVGGSLALGPALLVGGLNLVGFSAAGPVAAGIQSAVYGGAVASGSAFALAQSAAMGSIAVASGVELAAAAVATAAGAAMLKKAKNDQDDKDDKGGSNNE
ncbi:hypothetical protein FRC03_004939 [Tulasnella sp. 419]|nr:hypothetical protein FRC03_004939 [Tulasnella sp. 419]